MTTPKVLFLMADYGHDPTEVTVPYVAFKNAGFDVQFATETGKAPECDKLLVEGFSQKILGAKASVVQDYAKMHAANGQSIISDCSTTTLPARFEQVAYWGTRIILGDYYKIYGAGSEDVEDSVKKCLKEPENQYKSSLGLSPFVVEDEKYNYISARFPADAEEMAEKMVKLIKGFS
ncbi:hypothetical protein AK830_g12115 [Neonectria ditissima]|uniref:Uncharacterized protein n=1 Tax=Neonectria ditissima TaxID=78410 RepID=A0A0P7AKQ9_9HYPO|nr:hypothetical protein AK830_g12115 [Neonectria ditissima]